MNMRPIPKPLLKQILNDPAYELCRHPGCGKQAELEHTFTESGRQVNVKWAIIPCCPDHNRGTKLNKELNKHLAYEQATEKDIKETFPKTFKARLQEREWLRERYRTYFDE